VRDCARSDIVPYSCDSMLAPFSNVWTTWTELQIRQERKKKLYSKLHLHSIQTLQNIVRQRRFLERHAHQDPRGRIRGR